LCIAFKLVTMKSRHEESNPREQDANYNPTARNFDQTDVSGQPERMGGNAGSASGEEDPEDADQPLTKVDVEETGVTNEDLDRIEWGQKGETAGISGDRAQEQDGPVK
jgi:hypothetical protein